MQSAPDRFDFKLTPETRPFHIFQAFAQFRKAKFRHWNLHRWSDEIGMDCKTTLMNILQGKALPEGELAERMLHTMKIDPQLKSSIQNLIEVYRLKKAARKTS